MYFCSFDRTGRLDEHFLITYFLIICGTSLYKNTLLPDLNKTRSVLYYQKRTRGGVMAPPTKKNFLLYWSVLLKM